MSDGVPARSVVVEEACYNLPMELVLIIFKLSASSRKECAASISLVCSWARAIALPHLFSTIIIIGPPRTPSPFPERCGSLVRHLWIDNVAVFWRNAIPFFSACPNLVDICLPGMYVWALLEAIKELQHEFPPDDRLEKPVLSSDSTENHTAAPREPVFACRSLCVTDDIPALIWSMYDELPIGRAFLQGITHVRMTDLRISQPAPATFTPNLTHFALPYRQLCSASGPGIFFDYMDAALTRESLQKIVLIHSYPTTRATPPTIGDLDIDFLVEYVEARAGRKDVTSKVFVAFAKGKVTVDEWKEEVGGGTSIWKRATRVDEVMANPSSIAQALGDD